MQDPDRAHPPQHATDQHSQNGHQDPYDEEPGDLSSDDEDEPATRHASRGSDRREHEPDYQDDREYEKPLAPLPGNGLPAAFITGILAGAFIAIFNIVLTYLNAPTYNAAAQATGKTDTGLASFIIGLWCLNIVISLLVCFGVGFLMGKTKIARRLGFYAGATAGVIMYIGSFVVNYIPNYPGHINSTTSGNPTTGFITSLAVLIIQGFIGGLFGLWGAWAATRRSPYYPEA